MLTERVRSVRGTGQDESGSGEGGNLVAFG